ncbi:MAG: serine/threonine protein kinase, partial [Gemmataceae bacterium]|nr:serine/threonine protein kinase [Gemmataceae bacterium]
MHAEDATIPPALVEDATLPPGETAPRSGGAGGDAPPGYELLGELGRGGMGVVYKARDARLGRVVALKMILSGGHAGADDLARFRTEAQAVARLQHPGIVQVFEVGEHDGRPFMALEFCPGGSLDRKLAGTPMPPREAAALVRKVAEAVQAAHAAGVVHRDLKPANVLLTENGASKVTDFGLAKKLDDSGQTKTGSIMGTPSYMAPEQAEGRKDVGPLADVYALGAILYECLVGRPPFRAATAFDTILQVVGEEPVPPRTLNPAVPRDLETITLKCLAKEPGRRYPSGQDLADDLGRFLAGEPIKGRPVGMMERASKWVKRNRAVAFLGAAALLAMIAGTTASLWFAFRARAEADAARKAEGEAETNLDLAKKREKALEESAALLRTSVARSLARPLAFTNDSHAPGESEFGALAELASTTDEALRLQFVEELAASALGAAQLRVRGEYALQAALGLVAQRRDRAGKLLAARLQKDLAFQHRHDLLGVMASRWMGQEANSTVAPILAKALDGWEDQWSIE